VEDDGYEKVLKCKKLVSSEHNRAIILKISDNGKKEG